MKLEEELSTALAEERKTRCKAYLAQITLASHTVKLKLNWNTGQPLGLLGELVAMFYLLLCVRISDVCQYIEHVVALQD